MAARSGGNGRGPRSIVSRLRRRLRVTVGLDDAGQATERIRATTLVVVAAVTVAICGGPTSAGPLDWLGDFSVDQDLAMRTVSLGWFDLDHALPIALVDIDERTWRGWNSPAITPRAELVKLLRAVTAAAPAAVVVDIDLSWGRGPAAGVELGAEPGERELGDFLARYAGPTLVLPKRIESSESAMPRLAASPFDTVIAGNPHVSWAHASFQTDGDGKVRQWRDWLAVCADAGPLWLPSVPAAISAVTEPLPPGLQRSAPPGPADWDCAGTSEVESGAEQRLLLGPRLSGEGAHGIGSGARTVSAALLLDPEVARDDQALFAGRIVFLGATHESSGDRWLTTAGVLPGVELLANAVRYAALRSQETTRKTELVRRIATLALFMLFVIIDWYFRGVARVAVALAASMAFVVLAIGVFDDLRAFETLAAAVVMMIVYKGAEAVLEFLADVKAETDRRHVGLRGLPAAFAETLSAAARRPHAKTGGGSHDQQDS